MRIKILIAVTILINSVVIGQNLLRNTSFEDGVYQEHTYKDNNGDNQSAYLPFMSFDKDIEYWKGRMTKVNNGVADIMWHSPDWFCGNNPHKPHHEIHNNTTKHIYATNGDRYVGLRDYELIQQELTSTNRLEMATNYLINFDIYLSYRSSTPSFSITNNPESELKVYLAKHKVKYQKESGANNLCTSKYKNHKTGWGQSIVEIASFDLANYAHGEWLNIQEQFYTCNACLVNSDNYKWLVIEVVNKDPNLSNCRNAYVLIDNVKLQEGCDNGCSTTDGLVNITTNGYHTSTTPVLFYGFKNALKVEYQIQSYLGQPVTNIFTIEQPQNIIAWDGKNSTGAQLANNLVYRAVFDITTDCGITTKTLYFTKLQYNNNDTSIYLYKGKVSKPPEECCEEYIHLSNETLIQDQTLNQPLVYRAQSEIFVHGNVNIPNGNNVELIAGELITIKPPFHSEGNLHAHFMPCPNTITVTSGSLIEDCNEFDNLLIDTINIKQQIQQEFSFSIYPNPVNEIATITINSFESNIFYNIQIYDVFGEEKYIQQKINKNSYKLDLSTLSTGVYIIIIENEGEKYKSKIIKY